jgi:hypothetical protein
MRGRSAPVKVASDRTAKGSGILATPEQSGLLLLQEAQVFGLMDGDQAADGGPAGAVSSPVPLRVEPGELCPFLTLAKPIDGSHVRTRRRVLAATAISQAGRFPLAVLAVAGETTAADVEVLGSLRLRAGRASLALKPCAVA